MNSHDNSIGHAIPKSTIVGSYITLLFLTAVMVGLSRLNVSRFGIEWIDLQTVKAILIMSVALVMGIIVSMFLMGLRYESKLLNLTIFLSNFVFLLIFVLFTWADTSFRGEVDPSFNKKINFESPIKPGEAAAGGHGSAPAAGAGHEAGSGQQAVPATTADGAPSADSIAPVPTHETAPAAGQAAPGAAKPATPAKPAAPAPAH